MCTPPRASCVCLMCTRHALLMCACHVCASCAPHVYVSCALVMRASCVPHVYVSCVRVMWRTHHSLWKTWLRMTCVSCVSCRFIRKDPSCHARIKSYVLKRLCYNTFNNIFNNLYNKQVGYLRVTRLFKLLLYRCLIVFIITCIDVIRIDYV
jgi:hypothetical protein